MSIADTFDCPYHFKNHPCPDCAKDEKTGAIRQLIEQECDEYMNR